MYRVILALSFLGVSPFAVWATVPQQINHQGVVSVNGVPFSGMGLFRFAIVDPDAPSNLWSNDGSITGAVGGIPTLAVSREVVNGVYTVILGDINDPDMPNMTEEIAPSVFNDDNVRLRIWFDDEVNGLQQLTPDHKLTTAPYSARLPNIFTDDNGNVGIGENDPQGRLEIRSTGPSSAPFLVRNSVAGHDLRLDIQGDNRPWLTLYQNGTPKIRLDSGSGSFFTNSVGIGVTAPTKTLHVRGSGLLVEGDFSGPNRSILDVGWDGADDGSVQLLTLDVDIDNNQGGRRTYFNVGSQGDVTGKYGNYHVASDKRLKRNIVTIPNALQRVLSLRGVNFKWKDSNFDGDSLQIGMIAQEVEKVFPESVHTANDPMKTKAVEYEHLIGALVEAIKELDGVVKQKDSEISSQRKRIESFESRLAAIEASLPKVAQTNRGN